MTNESPAGAEIYIYILKREKILNCVYVYLVTSYTLSILNKESVTSYTLSILNTEQVTSYTLSTLNKEYVTSFKLPMLNKE